MFIEKSMQCTVLTVVWKASVYLLFLSSSLNSKCNKTSFSTRTEKKARALFQMQHFSNRNIGKAFRFGFGLRFFKGGSLHIYFLHFFSLFSLSWFPASSRGTNKQTRGVRPRSLPAAAVLSDQNDEISCPQLWVEHLALSVWAGELMVPNDSHLQVRDGWGPSHTQVKPICAGVGERE